ncbi:hypothetical protein PR048_009932, partial [Dryococelus australis]
MDGWKRNKVMDSHVWDQFCSHRTEDCIIKLKELKTWVVVIPRDAVKTETLVKSFKKCDITDALDGIEDNFLCEELESHSGEASSVSEIIYL